MGSIPKARINKIIIIISILNAMKVTLDKSICQMDKYKSVQVNLTNIQTDWNTG